MRRFIKFISVAALCVSLAAMPADARGRKDGQAGREQSQTNRRPQGGQRPGGGPGHQGGQRPGGPGHQGGQRPGGGPGHQGGQRPGGGNQYRPGGGPGHQGGQHPGGGNQYRPGGGHHNPGPPPGGGNHWHNPGPPPGGGHHWHHPGPPPGRPYGHIPPRPPYRPYMPARPVPFGPPPPPPGYRPARGPLFGSILGITIGTAIGVTLDYLLGHGYDVTGYTGDAVYINNVSQLNMLWPNATLYYGTGGMLRGSEYTYSTPYFDQGRYNLAYRYLTGTYGAPVSTMPLQGGGVRVNWFGYDGQYVSLQYQPAMAYDGSYRYFTTLTFGI